LRLEENSGLKLLPIREASGLKHFWPGSGSLAEPADLEDAPDDGALRVSGIRPSAGEAGLRLGR
jgi:hypothetical protein